MFTKRHQVVTEHMESGLKRCNMGYIDTFLVEPLPSAMHYAEGRVQGNVFMTQRVGARPERPDSVTFQQENKYIIY